MLKKKFLNTKGLIVSMVVGIVKYQKIEKFLMIKIILSAI